MLSKSQAGYLNHAPDRRSPCMTCRHFNAHRGACALVTGVIHARATCHYWHSVKSQDVAFPSS
jgi:hypothetical protein